MLRRRAISRCIGVVVAQHDRGGERASRPLEGDVERCSGRIGVEPGAELGRRVDLVAVDGDVIVAIDGYQVHSTAELRTRLYPDPPGTALDVTFQRAGSTLTTSVVLGDNDTDAPGDGSSP